MAAVSDCMIGWIVPACIASQNAVHWTSLADEYFFTMDCEMSGCVIGFGETKALAALTTVGVTFPFVNCLRFPGERVDVLEPSSLRTIEMQIITIPANIPNSTLTQTCQIEKEYEEQHSTNRISTGVRLDTCRCCLPPQEATSDHDRYLRTGERISNGGTIEVCNGETTTGTFRFATESGLGGVGLCHFGKS
jgi:hypothetical protein